MALDPTDARAAAAARDAGLSGEPGKIAQNCPKTVLEIGAFFDGTLNNRFNVLSRAREDDSYKNALSNVALLFSRYKSGVAHDERNSCGGTARAFRSFYVQGPGSTQGEADDTVGYAFGMGATGVEARVLDGFRQALRLITLFGVPRLEKVVFDVFGFSRGAAGARYFVNCLRARRISYRRWNGGTERAELPAGLRVEIRFVGIFDTVAAIGDPADDDNDPVNVHLKTEQATGRIYHLVAQDEYRRNFRLNRNWPGGGDRFALPGAHSDVGGGYRDPGDRAPLSTQRRYNESSRQRAEALHAAVTRRAARPGLLDEQRAVLVNEGWIRPNEPTGGLVHEVTPIRETVATVPSLTGPRKVTSYSFDSQIVLDRPWVQPGLNRIALHMMHEAAVAKVNGAFLDLPRDKADYIVPAGLKPYEGAIRAGQLAGADRAAVLRGFGHVSMKDGDLTDPNWIGHRAERNHRRTEYANQPGRAI